MSMFDVKESADRLLYRGFNLISDAAFFLSSTKRRLVARNERFRGIHAGERCFIIGTGPSTKSLHDWQLKKLANESVFAVNSFYKADLFSGITPKYYALMDNNYWGISSGTFGEISGRYAGRMPVFITDVRASDCVPGGADKGIFIYAKNYPVNRMRFNLAGNLSISMNVVSACILSAIFMGFKQIYLVGCDYNLFCGRVGTHCYDDSQEISDLPSYNLAFYLKYYHLTTEFHYLIAKTALDEGVLVRNVTPGSLLDAYAHQNLGEILS